MSEPNEMIHVHWSEPWPGGGALDAGVIQGRSWHARLAARVARLVHATVCERLAGR